MYDAVRDAGGFHGRNWIRRAAFNAYTFEIGSDDDEYLFTDGEASFSIPLMEIDWDF